MLSIRIPDSKSHQQVRVDIFSEQLLAERLSESLGGSLELENAAYV